MTELDRIIAIALSEDLPGGNDLTTDTLIPEDTIGAGWIEARENGVVSGLEVVEAVFHAVDSELSFQPISRDGSSVSRMEKVAEIRGRAQAILRGERTALNLLCHLSGIATMTRAFVTATKLWSTKILATRKTTLGLRSLEISAVRHGGGDIYRTNLSDFVLLKDNHLAILGGMSGVRNVLEKLRRKDSSAADSLLREGKIEASSPEEVAEAIAMGWKHILLDNFTPNDVKRTVDAWRNEAFLEVSGGVTLQNVAEYASTGVHAISIGAITHSARAIDFSLEVEWRRM